MGYGIESRNFRHRNLSNVAVQKKILKMLDITYFYVLILNCAVQYIGDYHESTF